MSILVKHTPSFHSGSLLLFLCGDCKFGRLLFGNNFSKRLGLDTAGPLLASLEGEDEAETEDDDGVARGQDSEGHDLVVAGVNAGERVDNGAQGLHGDSEIHDNAEDIYG
jgi:hypothetical protein